MECGHIYGILYFQIIVHKSQGMHLDLYIIVFDFLPLRFVAFNFSSSVSSLFYLRYYFSLVLFEKTILYVPSVLYLN